MRIRLLCAVALALLLAVAFGGLVADAAKQRHHHHTHSRVPPVSAPAVPELARALRLEDVEDASVLQKHPHKRVYHHQGESLGNPDQFLEGVDTERFVAEARLADLLEARESAGPGQFQVGAASYDVTGQIAEIGFMGYAVPGQTGSGLQLRLRARAFVIVDATPGSAGNRVVYVSLDLCMGFEMVKLEVIEMLQGKFGPDMYTHANVLLSGTHTHATPGGLGGTVLVDITTFGFIKENYNAAVLGIFNAIVEAHHNVEPATIKMAVGQCDGCNINRSPSAYLLDPERGQYANNTDHDMTVLRIESKQSGREIGMINFFAVHGTSLNNTNTLVSGDNKGYASLKFEETKNGPDVLPGQGFFVAAFGQSNLGDVSPNTRGPRCPDGTPCDFNTSTCGGFSQGCIASGPGVDQYDSQRIIGQMQIDAAMDLYNRATMELSGGVDYRHQYFNMENLTVSAQWTSTGQNATTCNAAMGYSFAAGTTDGPGDFDFTQGTTSPNPFWAWVSGLLVKPTDADVACQAPKPILLALGDIKPIAWVPTILPEQVYRIGNLWILAVPGEFTTMSGRRLRNMVQQQLMRKGQWFADSHVVIAGLSNSYSHYITTFEEFQQQRYEGASTLYGPNTLAAHMQNFAGIVNALVDGQQVPEGPLPIDMRNNTFSFMPGVVEDSVPAGQSFGSVATDVLPSYTRGQTVSVSFWGASPRNDLQTESSFLFVQLQDAENSWKTVAVDGNWETRFRWARVGLDQSLCTVEWDITELAKPGTYRIVHQGVSKDVSGTLTPYTGTSATFTVNA